MYSFSGRYELVDTSTKLADSTEIQKKRENRKEQVNEVVARESSRQNGNTILEVRYEFHTMKKVVLGHINPNFVIQPHFHP